MSYIVFGKIVIGQGTFTVDSPVQAYTNIISGMPVVYGRNTYGVMGTGENGNEFFVQGAGIITSRYALSQGTVLRLLCVYLTN